jgi:hypothetical protein
MLYKAIGENKIKALACDEHVSMASISGYRCQPRRLLIGRIQVDGCYVAGTDRCVQPPMHRSAEVKHVHLIEFWQMHLNEFPATQTHTLGY